MGRILIVSYGPGENSYTEQSVAEFISALPEERQKNIIRLDLATELPELFDREKMALYVRRNYKKENLSRDESAVMAGIDSMTDLLMDDVELLVLAFPIYNFNIPAAVKAWIDSVFQAGRAFTYGPYGPEGKLKSTRAIVLVSSGSTRIGSSKDFATPYLKYALQFVGITDVQFAGMTGTKLTNDREKLVVDFREQLAALVI